MIPATLTADQAERRRILFTHCKTKEEAHDWIYVHLEIDLPDVIVDPRTNCTPMEMIWDVYSHFVHPPTDGTEQPAERLFYANRFGGKTLGMAIAEVMLMLHLGGNIIHLAALKEQSADAQRYLKDFFSKPDLRGFMIGDNVEETVAVQYRPFNGVGIHLTEREFKALPPAVQVLYERVVGRAEIIAATPKAANGKHGFLLVLDELDLILNPLVLSEAVNIPTPFRRKDGTYIDPLTVMVSTRKTGGGPVQRAIDNQAETGCVVKFWNILATTQRCPTTRHRPDLPRLPIYRSDETLRAIEPATWAGLDAKQKEKYVLDEGYTGCLTNCKMFAACRGLLATKPGDAEFLKPISDTAKKFRQNSLDGARAQLLCLKASAEGLIYPMLDRQIHVIMPWRAYEMVFGKSPENPDTFTKAALLEAFAAHDGQWSGGQDYGYTHFFVTTLMYRFGALGFIMRVIAQENLDPVQQIAACEPIKQYEPSIYPDTAYPGQIALFRKAGFRMMDWNKGKGTVTGGIDIVRTKLAPATGEPELFFVYDVDEDPEIDLAFRHMAEYKWMRNAAGRPTDVPNEHEDDIPDGVRYNVMNVFPAEGNRGVIFSGMKTGAPSGVAKVVEGPAPVASAPTPWMMELVGRHLQGGGEATGGAGKKGTLSWST
jgi:hypothetical protein